MKKILIPIIGLLVLIFLTPVIIGKMANSNIDKKIEIFKKDGIQIKEIKQDIGYINSKRVFEVIFNKKTKKFNKYINSAKFLVTLTFKNLPITKANFNVLVKNINVLNQNILEGLKFHVVTKDFKTMNYNVENYNKYIILKDVNGVYKRNKYDNLIINAKDIGIKNFIDINGVNLNFIIKDLGLGLVDYTAKIKTFSFSYKSINIKGKSYSENVAVHLYPNQKYKFVDKFLADKMLIRFHNENIGISNVDWLFIGDNYKKDDLTNSDFNVSLLWSDTEYQKMMLGGANLKVDMKVLSKQFNTLKDIYLKASIELDKDLYQAITKNLNPEVLNKYFKNYKSNIVIKNGEIIVNGNRIQ